MPHEHQAIWRAECAVFAKALDCANMEVIVEFGSGSEFRTLLTKLPWRLDNGLWRCGVDGIEGGVDCNRVRPVAPTPIKQYGITNLVFSASYAKPFRNLPPGKIRIRLRHNQLAVASVRHNGTTRFFRVVTDGEDHWKLGPQVAANVTVS